MLGAFSKVLCEAHASDYPGEKDSSLLKPIQFHPCVMEQGDPNPWYWSVATQQEVSIWQVRKASSVSTAVPHHCARNIPKPSPHPLAVEKLSFIKPGAKKCGDPCDGAFLASVLVALTSTKVGATDIKERQTPTQESFVLRGISSPDFLLPQLENSKVTVKNIQMRSILPCTQQVLSRWLLLKTSCHEG